LTEGHHQEWSLRLNRKKKKFFFFFPISCVETPNWAARVGDAFRHFYRQIKEKPTANTRTYQLLGVRRRQKATRAMTASVKALATTATGNLALRFSKSSVARARLILMTAGVSFATRVRFEGGVVGIFLLLASKSETKGIG
jgi:hypothetical protein